MTIFELLGVLRFLYPIIQKVRPPLTKGFFSLFPATKRAHFNELRTRLRQMPFIYRPRGDKHFGDDLESDYVQIWMRPLWCPAATYPPSLLTATEIAPGAFLSHPRGAPSATSHSVIEPSSRRTAASRPVASSAMAVISAPDRKSVV